MVALLTHLVEGYLIFRTRGFYFVKQDLPEEGWIGALHFQKINLRKGYFRKKIIKLNYSTYQLKSLQELKSGSFINTT